MKFIKMHYSNPVAWLYMPQIIERVKAFADKYELDHNAEWTAEAVRTQFVNRHPLLLAWAVVDGPKVVGHAVTCLDTITDFDGQPMQRRCTIMQMERDKDAIVDDRFRKVVLAKIKEWADDNFCDDILALAEGSSRVNYFKTLGFKVDKTLLKYKPKE